LQEIERCTKDLLPPSDKDIEVKKRTMAKEENVLQRG
jgi:hypothetical protein